MAGSRELVAEFFDKGFTENEKVDKACAEVFRSSFLDDFFSDTSLTSPTTKSVAKSADKVTIATLDIGRYRPEDITWSVEDDHVLICGKHCAKTSRGAEGGKFVRSIPLPEDIKTQSVTARFCMRDGQLIVEGTKNVKKKLTRTSSQTAYFGDCHFSLSMDLDDCMSTTPRTAEISSSPIGEDSERNRIKLF
ncbi:predicted protein [Nematostella vectensis]|uniref:SHSP domain-containing protein n=1 Tax=Nematostella vectensis TaxID=45351 RepID=A7SDV3_NEMVE|nr:predicted protein [Nematostella vectensis]|eukprot:XP_001630204.1 predicted protein [Nematostella vectensis]